MRRSIVQSLPFQRGFPVNYFVFVKIETEAKSFLVSSKKKKKMTICSYFFFFLPNDVFKFGRQIVGSIPDRWNNGAAPFPRMRLSWRHRRDSNPRPWDEEPSVLPLRCDNRPKVMRLFLSEIYDFS